MVMGGVQENPNVIPLKSALSMEIWTSSNNNNNNNTKIYNAHM